MTLARVFTIFLLGTLWSSPVWAASDDASLPVVVSAEGMAAVAAQGEGDEAERLQETPPELALPSWESLTQPERLTGNLQLMASMAALTQRQVCRPPKW